MHAIYVHFIFLLLVLVVWWHYGLMFASFFLLHLHFWGHCVHLCQVMSSCFWIQGSFKHRESAQTGMNSSICSSWEHCTSVSFLKECFTEIDSLGFQDFPPFCFSGLWPSHTFLSRKLCFGFSGDFCKCDSIFPVLRTHSVLDFGQFEVSFSLHRLYLHFMSYLLSYWAW